MAGLMRMTNFQQRTMCDFVGATHFNEFMTKNELSHRARALALVAQHLST